MRNFRTALLHLFVTLILLNQEIIIMPNTNPKLPKRKKSSGLGRKKKGGNKKRSSYNYDAARASMDMPSANHAQISQFAAAAGPNPPTQKSPLKSEYKAMLKSKVEEFESVVKEKEEVLTQNNELKSVLNSKDKKYLHSKPRFMICLFFCCKLRRRSPALWSQSSCRMPMLLLLKHMISVMKQIQRLLVFLKHWTESSRSTGFHL